MRHILNFFNLNRAPWLVLACSLVITFLLWRAEENTVSLQAEARFLMETRKIELAIEERLRKYELMLQGCIGLFYASDFIIRHEWKIYVQSLDPLKNYTGIQGIGFAKRVSAAEKESHIQKVRAEGFPEYAVRPPGDRAEYFPIIYLEPFSGRNLRAFGYDMFSEQVRKTAMEKARDRGVTAMSGKVLLVQETKQDIQHGFLMYLPLYEKNRSLTTVQERRAALLGFIYSPFRMNDFMQGLFKHDTAAIAWEVYNGHEADSDALLYRSCDSAKNPPDGFRPLYEQKAELNLFGETWTLAFKTLPSFEAAIDRSRLFFIVCAGLLVSFLLFTVTFLIVARSNMLDAEIIRREREQKALLESEEKFKAMVETVPLAICLSVGIEQKCEYLNPAFIKLFGYTREDIPTVEQWWPRAYPEETYRREVSEEWARRVRGALETQSSIEPMEVVCTCKDGSKKNISWGYITLGDKNYSCGLDLTERKHAEEELQAKNDELIRFNYAVSHDLKSPLVTIKTFLGFLEQDMARADSEQVAQDLAYVHTATDKMHTLLQELISLSRIGHVANPAVEAPLQDIVQEALDLVAGRIVQRSVRVQMYEGQTLLFGDRPRLVEVFQNLLDNAVKFMGEQTEPLIEIGAEKKNGALLYFVRDNGMGIEPRHTDKLFGLFEKLNSGMEGSGLGLALVKRIIEAHGGSIWVESEGIGKGACFYFTLPRKSSES